MTRLSKNNLMSHQIGNQKKIRFMIMLTYFLRETSFRMFREGEGRELVRLLREAEKEADEREKTAQEEAINCNLKIKIRNKLKVISTNDTILQS